MKWTFFSDNFILEYIIYVATVILGAFIVYRIFNYILKKFITRNEGKYNEVATHYNFISNALGFITILGTIIFIFYIIPPLRNIGISLFAGAGIMAAAIGFASQSAISNIINGLFIVIFKPFRVKDFIEIAADKQGIVEDITLRHTVIKTFENKRLIVPNSVIGSEIILNASITQSLTNNHLLLGISYDSNVDLAIKIIREEAENNSQFLDNRSDEELEAGIPAVKVRIVNFGDSSIDLRAEIWSASPTKGFDMKCELRKSIKKRFDEEGIEIPFPHRTIVQKNPK